jgi:hypothetical protein
VVQVQDERNGALTVLFVEPNGGKQFLIEAVPYLQVDIVADTFAPPASFRRTAQFDLAAT